MPRWSVENYAVRPKAQHRSLDITNVFPLEVGSYATHTLCLCLYCSYFKSHLAQTSSRTVTVISSEETRKKISFV